MSGGIYAYLFEAKAIQRYLFLGGKLRDVVGASDLVAQIANSEGKDWIGDIVDGHELTTVDAVSPSSPANKISFSRRAGGAFCIHGHHETLIAIRRAIRLKVMKVLPGLEFSDALAEDAGEIASMKAAFAQSGGTRANSAASVLPLGRPVFAIVPRTGLPMVAETGYADPLDRILQAQRRRADDLQTRMGTVQRENPDSWFMDGVAKRFHGKPTANEAFAYPRNLDDSDEDTGHNPHFPFLAEDKRIGLVHADISGLGQIYTQASSKSAEAGLVLARKIEAAILTAVQQVNHELLLPNSGDHEHFRKIVPARPLVIGGDDITLIVRADLALPFAAKLLVALEETTKSIRAKNDHDWEALPEALTACAGVAISRAGLPFLTMNALAESLCHFAKTKAKAQVVAGKPYASMLAFHVQTQTAEEEYANDIYPGLNLKEYGSLTGNPYRVGEFAAHIEGYPEWDKLAALARAIDDLDGAANSLRRIRGLIANGRLSEAHNIWHRMCSRNDRPSKYTNSLIAAIKAITGVDPNIHALPGTGALFDALELINLGTLKHLPSIAQTTNALEKAA